MNELLYPSVTLIVMPLRYVNPHMRKYYICLGHTVLCANWAGQFVHHVHELYFHFPHG